MGGLFNNNPMTGGASNAAPFPQSSTQQPPSTTQQYDQLNGPGLLASFGGARNAMMPPTYAQGGYVPRYADGGGIDLGDFGATPDPNDPNYAAMLAQQQGMPPQQGMPSPQNMPPQVMPQSMPPQPQMQNMPAQPGMSPQGMPPQMQPQAPQSAMPPTPPTPAPTATPAAGSTAEAQRKQRLQRLLFSLGSNMMKQGDRSGGASQTLVNPYADGGAVTKPPTLQAMRPEYTPSNYNAYPRTPEQSNQVLQTLGVYSDPGHEQNYFANHDYRSPQQKAPPPSPTPAAAPSDPGINLGGVPPEFLQQLFRQQQAQSSQAGGMKVGGAVDFRPGGQPLDPQAARSGARDTVPALLDHGEWVMTRDAVRGAGNGSLARGAARMDKMMRAFEAKGKAFE